MIMRIGIYSIIVTALVWGDSSVLAQRYGEESRKTHEELGLSNIEILQYRATLEAFGGDETLLFDKEKNRKLLMEGGIPDEFLIDLVTHPEQVKKKASVWGAWKLIEWRGISDNKVEEMALSELENKGRIDVVLPYLVRNGVRQVVDVTKQVTLSDDLDFIKSRGGDLVRASGIILSPNEAVEWMAELEGSIESHDADSVKYIKAVIKYIRTNLRHLGEEVDPELWLIRQSAGESMANGSEESWAKAMILNHHNNEEFWLKYKSYLETKGVEYDRGLWWTTYKLRQHFLRNVVNKPVRFKPYVDRKKKMPEKKTPRASKPKRITEVAEDNIETSNNYWKYALGLLALVAVWFIASRISKR